MKADKSKLSLARVCLCMGLERTDCPFRVPSVSQVQFVVKACILQSQPGLHSGPSLPLAVWPGACCSASLSLMIFPIAQAKEPNLAGLVKEGGNGLLLAECLLSTVTGN